MHSIDPKQMDVAGIYALMTSAIVPRPIAWVSSQSTDGVVNLAPYSYFNGLCSRPPAIMFSPVNWPDGQEKDTCRNIRETGEFVVNIVPRSLAQQMHDTSQRFPPNVSEVEEVNLSTIPSTVVAPPRVAESPVHFECKLMRIITVGEGGNAANVVFGEVVMFHIAEQVGDASGNIDLDQLDAIGRLGGRQYTTIHDRFNVG